ncbi:hypothetical protein [Xanthomonas sacchari]|uniref:hypothetical protein n=1 Tax=Xanthomonas sacchari TaxID=56458 RepID=UPI00225DE0D4|nr:hypothetical protein [Xanthomonas sacchari]MCW0435152.1 hypothetical protein [Xanthomonas sacchari]
MTEPTHYHQRIQRATERLAQLQAKELLASQRQAVKAKEAQRREEAKRRTRVSELVFLAGAEMLDDEELVGALLSHLHSRQEFGTREHAASLGAKTLGMIVIENNTSPH